MSPLLKRVLLIVTLLVTSALIGYGLYYFFQKSAPTTTKPPTTIPTSGGKLPTAGERPIGTTTTGGVVTGETTLPVAGYIPQIQPNYYKAEPVKKLTTDNATYASLAQNGTVRYHNASDGKFYHIASDGTVKEMADQVFFNVQKVTWAKTKDEAVLEYPDGNKVIYNFETKKQVSIPKHWEQFSFSPDSNEIAAKSVGLSPENRWLITFNDDGTGARTIEPMGENGDKVQVNWSPNKQVVAFSATGLPLGADRKEILFVGLNGENFKSTIVEGLDFRPQWSPSGSRLLYSVYSARNNYNPELWVVDSYGDSIGKNRQALKINTWADKCVFQNTDTLYCAVPRDLPQGAGMLPDLANSINDDLYKIDLKTGLKTNIDLGGDYQISTVSVDTANNKVIFTDKNQSGVFEVKI